jgi:hypothetical protein
MASRPSTGNIVGPCGIAREFSVAAAEKLRVGLVLKGRDFSHAEEALYFCSPEESWFCPAVETLSAAR